MALTFYERMNNKSRITGRSTVKKQQRTEQPTQAIRTTGLYAALI